MNVCERVKSNIIEERETALTHTCTTHQVWLLILFRIPTINFKVLDLFLLRRRCGSRLERSIGGERTSQCRLELYIEKKDALDLCIAMRTAKRYHIRHDSFIVRRLTNPLLGLEILRDNMFIVKIGV